MSETELDAWFFDLPACAQMILSGIYLDEDGATDADYERFDCRVTTWWDAFDYDEKLEVYELYND
jgi:hypothetical protein